MLFRKVDIQVCPYGAKKKCTYGNKCKFFHPERGSQPHKSVAEKLSDFANFHLQSRNSEAIKKQVQGKSLSVPLNYNNLSIPSSSVGENSYRKQALCRTSSNVLSSLSSLQPQQQQQHLAPPSLPNLCLTTAPQALSASTSPTNNMPHQLHQQHQQFLKSHSIDNLPREMYQTINYNHCSMWNQHQQSENLPQQPVAQMDSQDVSINLHKKLQRQLSLINPYDPRLYTMQQYHHNPPSHMVPGNLNQEQFQMSSPPHKALSSSHSLTGSSTQKQIHSTYEHQNVMRIASAPNSSNKWNTHVVSPTTNVSLTSSSEPHINWPIADQRRRLHYHLCNIFPKKGKVRLLLMKALILLRFISDVEQAMLMFPDEANPQKICSAILNIQR